MRILITGSRTWTDRSVIAKTLDPFPDGSILVSGACPSGADKLCEEYADQRGWKIERHAARWQVDGAYNSRAGFERNEFMVALGADVCVAFVHPCKRCSVKAERLAPHGSHGALHTYNLAQRAGMETRLIREGW